LEPTIKSAVTEAGETTVPILGAPNLDTRGTPLLALRSEWLRGDNSPDADVDVRMHPLTLRFDDEDLESEFEEEYFHRTLIPVRWAVIVGLCLYSVYGVVDFWLAPAQRSQIWMIRYAVVGPACLLCLGFSFTRHFRKYKDLAVSLMILIALLGIVAITSITPQPLSSL